MEVADRQPPEIFSPQRICLFLDLDGTLVDFAATPQAVRVAPQLVRTLQSLYTVLDGALAIVSGRPVHVIDHLLSPLRLPVGGLHGYELRDRRQQVRRGFVQLERLHTARLELAQFVANCTGLLFEDKGAALAVHYRGAPQLKPQVEAELVRVATPLFPEFELLRGELVYEIKPARFGKANVVDALMRQPPFFSRVPVFVGDDITDCSGFAAVLRHGGMTVAVGERLSAQWYLPSPSAARHWLAQIANLGAH